MMNDIGEAGHVGKSANYFSRNNSAELASTNIDTDLWQDVVSEIEHTTELRPDAADPVKTHIISLADGESLTKEQWKEVIDRYIKDMGYENAPYAAWIHKDTDNEHVHIIASRVNYDGSLVRTSHDYYKGQKEMRQFEKELGLQICQNSWEIRDGAAKTAELKSYEKSGNVPDRLVLQEHIKEAINGQPSLQEFRHRLEDRGVKVHLNESKSTGRISGISYEYEGRTYKGSDIGNGSKWGEVQKGLDLQEKSQGKTQEPSKDQARPLEQPRPAAPPKDTRSPERQEVDRIKGEIDATWQTQKTTVQSLQTRMQYLQDRIEGRTENMKLDQDGLRNRGDLAEVRRKYAPEIQALKGEQREWKAQERAIKEELQAKRLDLVEQRYRAEVRAVNTEFRGRGQEGSPKHLERLERVDQHFAKDAGRVAKEMERSVKAKEAWAGRAGRTPNLAVDRKGQVKEVAKGVGQSLAEASKTGGKILQHQAQHAKEISGAARDFLKTRSPEAKGRLVETVGRAVEGFKRDIAAASERLKEAWGKVGERVAALDERTRPQAVETRINRTLEEVKTERSSHGLALGHDAGPGARTQGADHQGRGESRSQAASAGAGHGADRHRADAPVGNLEANPRSLSAEPGRDTKRGRGTEAEREGLETGRPQHQRTGVEAPGSGGRRGSDQRRVENRTGLEGGNAGSPRPDGSKDRGIAPGRATEAHRSGERTHGEEGRRDRSQGQQKGPNQHDSARPSPVKQHGALVQGQPISRTAEAASLNLPGPAGKAAKAGEIGGRITTLSDAMNHIKALRAAMEKDPHSTARQIVRAAIDVASPAAIAVAKALEKGLELER